jgi:type IV pilus biogenesis protein CpaD/CtpE
MHLSSTARTKETETCDKYWAHHYNLESKTLAAMEAQKFSCAKKFNLPAIIAASSGTLVIIHVDFLLIETVIASY